MPSSQEVMGEYNDGGFLTGIQQADKSPPSVLGVGLVLAQSAVPVSVTGVTVETVLASIPVPGGLMGPNGSMRVYAVWTMTASANEKRLYARMGAGLDLFAAHAVTGPTIASANKLRVVQNRGVENSQISYGSWAELGLNSAPNMLGTVNTAAPWVLTIAGKLVVPAETLTLEGYIVEVFPG